MPRIFMLLTIVIFLLILSLLVIAHEAGHFVTAKYFGVQVEEFGLGFPPRAKTLATTKDGVAWTLNWLPLGGFVKLKGEDGANRSSPDSFSQKSATKRVIILAAGVVMNLLLGMILLSIGFAIGWPQDLTTNPVDERYIAEKKIMITHVEPDTPAARADIKRGDIIVTINTVRFAELIDLQKYVTSYNEREVDIALRRGKEIITKRVIPELIQYTPDERAAPDEKPFEKIGIGVALGTIGVVKYPLQEAVVLGVKNTGVYSVRIVQAFGNLFKDLFIHRKISENVGGPVMIAALTGRAAQMGTIYILQFIALLSLNLAIINILPIPALDGGRILFVIIEKFKGRAVSMNVETWTHLIGFWLLIALTFLITARDIARLDVWEKLKNLFA